MALYYIFYSLGTEPINNCSSLEKSAKDEIVTLIKKEKNKIVLSILTPQLQAFPRNLYDTTEKVLDWVKKYNEFVAFFILEGSIKSNVDLTLMDTFNHLVKRQLSISDIHNDDTLEDIFPLTSQFEEYIKNVYLSLIQCSQMKRLEQKSKMNLIKNI